MAQMANVYIQRLGSQLDFELPEMTLLGWPDQLITELKIHCIIFVLSCFCVIKGSSPTYKSEDNNSCER